jgi:hypothetical protein
MVSGFDLQMTPRVLPEPFTGRSRKDSVPSPRVAGPLAGPGR